MFLLLREYLWVLLLPVSLFWAVATFFRRRLFGASGYHSKLRVICVGNIHSGGSGKTPIVAEIANHYKEKNSIILSRGYKRKSTEPVLELATSQLEGANYYGDEPWMLYQKTQRPVFVGGNRRALAKAVEKKYQGATLVMDDGFQNFGLRKNVSLVVINAQQPFLESFCLPFGELREPLSAIEDADAVVLIKSGSAENLLLWRTYLDTTFTDLVVFEAESATSDLQNSSFDGVAFAFSGIARPENFAKSVSELGLGKFARRFPDHHSYSDADIAELVEQKKKTGADYFLTTEKDFYKVQVQFSAIGEKVTFLKHRVLLPNEFWIFLDSKVEAAA